MTSVCELVPILVTATFAFATEEPVLSVTVPTIVPVAVCDHAKFVKANRNMGRCRAVFLIACVWVTLFLRVATAGYDILNIV
jgi:hypothetical protein